jgi:FKBP-type peptidyl-prolyl cis-trans isomerase
MQVGGERQILVPPSLAYGEEGVCVEGQQGTDCLIPPNSIVKYDVILKRVAISPI